MARPEKRPGQAGPAALRQDAARRWRWLCAAMLLLLAPAFLVAVYARPSADDFIYARATHAVVRQYGADWPRLLQAAAEADLYFYNSWQGLYVSGFLLALQPAIFGGQWYGLTFVLVAAMLFLALLALARAVVRRLAPEARGMAPFAALTLAFAFVQGMPNQVESLYWYNGAMNYVPFFALTLCVLALLIGLLPGQSLRPVRARPLRAGVCCALCLLIGGGHHVVILLALMLLAFAALWFARKRSFWPVAPLAAALAGLYLNMSSPGTAVRMSGFSSASLPEAVGKSFLLAALSILRWLDLPLVCLLLLLTPSLWRLAQSRALGDGAFRRSWLPPVVTFVLVWGMIWLPSYTMGGIGPGRLINIAWMTFVLGAVVSWAVLLGWLGRVRRVAVGQWIEKLSAPGRRAALTAAALVLCIACIGGHTVKEGLDNRFATSLEAAWELANGTPQAYAAAMDEREAILTDPETADAVIRPLTEDERPGLLYFSDVTPGPDSWGLTEYYGKNSVYVEGSDA